MALLQRLALLLSATALAAAHGIVSGIVIDGKYYSGYAPGFQYQDPPPTVIGWSVPLDLDRGYINPGNYSNSDIICHKSATPGGTHATVAAGGEIELQWTEWPESHHGPVLDYLAKCNGECEKVDKTSLEFFKIYEAGLNEWVTQPGNWASDDLIANNNSHTVKIPSNIAPGNYVLRHEIIALHSANNLDGAQNYPQCINLEITGSGTESPAGVPGTELYKADDPGILINIYYPALTTYTIPGPSLYSADAAAATTTAVSSSQQSQAPATTSAAGQSSITLATTPDGSVTTAPTSTKTTTTSAGAVYTTAYETAVMTVLVTMTATNPATATFATTTSDGNIFQATSTSSPLPVFTSPATPTSGSYGSAPIPPSKPLPKGFSLEDLLQWVDYLLATGYAAKERVHARDFGAV